jgi:hypothetical protein
MADFCRAPQKASSAGSVASVGLAVPQPAPSKLSRLTQFQAALAAASPLAEIQRIQAGSKSESRRGCMPALSPPTGAADGSGLPDALKATIEGLSHISLDDPVQELEAHRPAPSAQPVAAAAKALGHGAARPAPVVQRAIGGYLPPHPGGIVFYREGSARPKWIGQLAALAPAALTSLNHVISYHHIAESLTNVLNAVYGPIVAKAASADAPLLALTESLYTSATPEVAAMRVTRGQLIAEIAKAGAATDAKLTQYASELEEHLNSSPDNVRQGDASRNMSISSAIDPDFAGDVDLAGKTHASVLDLKGITKPAGWGTAAGFGKDQAGTMLTVFRVMTTSHNSIVWNFYAAAPSYLEAGAHRNMLAIVLNDEKKSQRHDVAFGSAMSSGPSSAAAAPAALPVVIFDPTGVALPITMA